MYKLGIKDKIIFSKFPSFALFDPSFGFIIFLTEYSLHCPRQAPTYLDAIEAVTLIAIEALTVVLVAFAQGHITWHKTVVMKKLNVHSNVQVQRKLYALLIDL